MKLFENKVGRPSNEILKKRKIFKISIITSVIILIGLVFSLGIYGTNNLRGTSYQPGTQIKLSKTKVYLSNKSKIYVKRSGDFYIWGSEVSNGRIRITKYKNRIGKRTYIAGWIKTSDINIPTTTTTTKAQTSEFQKGDAVKLSNTSVYISSSIKTSAGKYTGTYYIYDSAVSNGRIRIINKLKTITFWVKIDSISKTNDVGLDDTTSSTIKMTTNLNGFSNEWRPNTSGTVNVAFNDKSETFTATTSNSSVIRIEEVKKDSFKIVAKSAGAATIKIKSNSGLEESKTFTVKSSGNNDAIQLSRSTGGNIKMGAASDIKVTLKDSTDTYEVVSSNQAVVAVTNINKESFKFQGVGEGTATITATSKKTGKTATLTFNVGAFELPANSKFGTGVTLTKKGTYNTLPVYLEKGKCDTTANISNVNKFINDINQFNSSKTLDKRAIASVKAIYMVSHNTFNAAWKNLWPTAGTPTSDTTGVSSSGQYSYIILKCDRYYSHTLAHEVGHSMDARYGYVTGKTLNSDFTSLYNTYNKNKGLALRTYSYGNTKEFFADSFARYRGEASWKFPQDLQNATTNAINKVVNLKNW